MAIRIYVTGGTFDKEYDMLSGQLYFKDTHLPEIFAMGRCTLDISIRTLMMIDSLEMTEDDRALIVRSCRNTKHSKIVITHGTDTMVQTATKIAEAGIEGKTIILTGAMIPYKFGSSDGFFNLGSALAFAQSLSPGVYLAINGKYFPWNKVKKNRKTGFFELLEE